MNKSFKFCVRLKLFTATVGERKVVWVSRMLVKIFANAVLKDAMSFAV